MSGDGLYQVNMDPEQAKQLAQQGATLLLLDVPQGTALGVDQQASPTPFTTQMLGLQNPASQQLSRLLNPAVHLSIPWQHILTQALCSRETRLIRRALACTCIW